MSCCPHRVLHTGIDETTTVTETVRHVEVVTPPDTTTAVYEISVAGITNTAEVEVQVKIVSEQPGRYTAAPKVTLKGNKLIVTTTTEPPSQSVEVRDTETITTRVTTTYIEVNRLTGWQWFQIWLGRILGLLFLAIVFIRVKRVLSNI
jgi:hypothetical protein